MADGWKCPNCGGAHGPHVDSCPVGVMPRPSMIPMPPIYPVWPQPSYPPEVPFDPARWTVTSESGETK